MSSSKMSSITSLFAPSFASAWCATTVGGVVSVDVSAIPDCGTMTFPARSATFAAEIVTSPGTIGASKTSRTRSRPGCKVAETTFCPPLADQFASVSADVTSTSSDSCTSTVMPVGSSLRFWSPPVAVGGVVSPATVCVCDSVNAWPSTSSALTPWSVNDWPFTRSKARSMVSVFPGKS